MGFFQDLGQTFNNTVGAVAPLVTDPFKNAYNAVSNTAGGNFSLQDWVKAGLGPAAPWLDMLSPQDQQMQLRANPGEAPEAPEQAYQRILQEQQNKYAKNFRQGLPSLKTDIANKIARSGYGQTDEEIGQVNKSANRRGLLNSGIRDAGEANVRASGATDIASRIAQANMSLEDQANTLDQQAIKGGLDMQKDFQSIEDQIYNRALENMRSRNAALSGFGGAIGAIGGTAAANAGSK